MENRPTFSILHATARFPGWRMAYEDWSKKWSMQFSAEYILAVEEKDAHKLPEHPELVSGLTRIPFRTVVQNERSGSCVANWNAAAAVSRGKILILAEDDAFPSKGWDAELMKALLEKWADASWTSTRRNSDEFVAWISTGMPRDADLIVHGIMSRALYERWGYFYYPEYVSMYADDDLTAHAKQDGVVVDLRHIRHEHMHPSRTGRVQDEVFRRQNSKRNFQIGADIFKRRLAEGFASKSAEKTLVA